MRKSPLQYFLYLSISAAIVTIVLKSYAYYITGSVGFMSDALESFVNLFAAIFALLMLIISQKPADKKHMYGHSKAEYFSSAAEGALIIIAAFSIIRSAIPRIFNPVSIENVDLGLILSFIASLVNLGVGSVLISHGKKKKSLILEADGRHLMTDVWTSLGVIVGIIVVKFTGWFIVDPIIALLVAVNIMYTGYKLIKRSARGLMDVTIPDEDMRRIIVYLDSLKSRQIEYHSLMTRVAGQRKFIFFHLLVPGEWPVKRGHDCADEIEEHLISMFIEPVTVDTHLDPVEDPASMNDIGIDRIH